MSITSPVFLQTFSKIKKRIKKKGSSLPSCLLCTGLAPQTNQFIKGRSVRIPRRSSWLIWNTFFLLNIVLFSVFLNFCSVFLTELDNSMHNGVVVMHAKTRIIETPCNCNLGFLAAFLQLMHWWRNALLTNSFVHLNLYILLMFLSHAKCISCFTKHESGLCLP